MYHDSSTGERGSKVAVGKFIVEGYNVATSLVFIAAVWQVAMLLEVHSEQEMFGRVFGKEEWMLMAGSLSPGTKCQQLTITGCLSGSLFAPEAEALCWWHAYIC